MKIFVCIKQVPDTETKIELNSTSSGINDDNIKWAMNPYDEFAVEEALTLKKNQPDSSVTVVSLGPKKRITEALRQALAMGADEAILINTEEFLDPFATAKALSKVIQAEPKYDIIFTGKLAIDDNAASVSQALAEYLDCPHTTVVNKFEWVNNTALVEREVEGGAREVVQLQGAPVIAANKGLNTPRYANLPGIMKAKKKPLKEIELASLGISTADNKLKWTNFSLPDPKPPVQMLSGDASEQASVLVKELRETVKVI